jgi:hypothetical protein
MEDAIKQRLTNRDLWLRALFMVLFAIAYSIAELVITIVVVLQFFVVLFAGRANENLLALGNNLSTYVYQILQFETFNTETRPYPFQSWPSAEPGENRWTGEPPSEAPIQPGAAPDPTAAAAGEPTKVETPAADDSEDRPG